MRKIGRRESGRTSEREGEGNCLNHGLNGLRRFHGLKSLDGRDLKKISIALTVRSVDLVPRRNGEKQGISIALLIQSLDGRDSEIAPTNAGVR